jgi:hypothetical protein
LTDRVITLAMDFLKSAVASIAKGPAFPYTFGDRVDIDQSIWTLYNGTRRVRTSKISHGNSTTKADHIPGRQLEM